MKKNLVKIKLDGEIYYAVKTSGFKNWFNYGHWAQYKDLISHQAHIEDSYPATGAGFRHRCLTKEMAFAALAYFGLPEKKPMQEKVIG